MPPTPPTDAELDALILARLALLGIDLEQLPLSDPEAPADRTRVMRSLRSFLRSTPPVISDYSPSVQDHPPVLYPAPFSAWTR
jgi:DNA polymerase III epsilon subunit-like protein